MLGTRAGQYVLHEKGVDGQRTLPDEFRIGLGGAPVGRGWGLGCLPGDLRAYSSEMDYPEWSIPQRPRKPPMNIQRQLKDLGFGEYAAVFEKEAIWAPG